MGALAGPLLLSPPFPLSLHFSSHVGGSGWVEGTPGWLLFRVLGIALFPAHKGKAPITDSLQSRWQFAVTVCLEETWRGPGGCRGGGRGGQRREPACCWLISAVEVQMEQAPAPVCLSWRLNLESPRTPSPCREERGGGRGGRGAEPRGRAHLVNPLEAAWKPGLRGKMRVEGGRVGMYGASK